MQPIPDHDELIDKIGELVEPASEPEDDVLEDQARIVRWVGPLFVLFSVIMVPWAIYLAVTLPSRELSADYDVAWAGFDVMLAAGLGATGYFALRRSRYLSTAAAATAALLVVDAWFDVTTTPAHQRIWSILAAILLELPLAAVCLWLSHHTLQLEERRIVLLMRRSRLRAGRRRPARKAAPQGGKSR